MRKMRHFNFFPTGNMNIKIYCKVFFFYFYNIDESSEKNKDYCFSHEFNNVDYIWKVFSNVDVFSNVFAYFTH